MSECLFCKITRKEIKSKAAFEDEEILAIHDVNTQAPTHLLIIPKKHIARIADLTEQDIELAGKIIYRAKQIASQNHLEHYRILFNNGEGAGQSVFHIHLHLLSGRRMGWPPG